ncbi:TetR/AcrR family transcriptional regulator [Hoeflea sp.]|uniref:TetR/AcrR family transcriptional regulator n=1 Tax=Hoeflea sp. TaxID=1940281 RepID=UPI003B525855
MNARQSLTPSDWINAAFRLLSEQGPKAIRVDLLCQALGVTKGSFYWHFRDLAALKAEMIARWRQAAARDLIDAATRTDLSPRDLIISLFTEVQKRQAQGGSLAETALRQWSDADATVQKLVREADNERLAFLTTQIRAAGITGGEARSRAAFMYAALIGMEQLAGEPALTPANMAGVIDAILGAEG